MKKALTILGEGFEEIEAIIPIDLLRRAGVEVRIATTLASPYVKGKNAIGLVAELDFNSAAKKPYDLILLPGGPSTPKLAANTKLIEFIKQQTEKKTLIGAICAAPLILHKAGILKNKKFTAHFSVFDTLKKADKKTPLIQDENIITAQGAGTSFLFAFKLIENLFNSQKVEEIKSSICYIS